MGYQLRRRISPLDGRKWWSEYYKDGNVKVGWGSYTIGSTSILDFDIIWDKVHPYQLIPVTASTDIVDGTGRIIVKKNQTTSFPAYAIMAWIIKNRRESTKEGIATAIDIALLATGAGEIKLALRGGLTLANAFRLTKTIADLGIGLADIAFKVPTIRDALDGTNTGKAFLENWNKFQLLYGLASVSYELVSIAKSARTNINATKNGLNSAEQAEIDRIVARMEKYVNINTNSVAQRIIDIESKGNSLTKVKNLSVNAQAKLENIEDEFIIALEQDLNHPNHGDGIKQLLDENPDDISIWRGLKEDPALHWELNNTLYKTDPRWQKWSQRAYFQEVTSKGKLFEETTCLNKFKERGVRNANGTLTGASDWYTDLYNKVQNDYGINLHDYDLFSQVQMKFPNPVTLSDGKIIDYFVADQLLVKFDNLGSIEDIIIIENKLQHSTSLTINQNTALNFNNFTVRNTTERFSEYGTSRKLSATQNANLNFNTSTGNIKWYKAYDNNDGNAISGIKKWNTQTKKWE